MGNTLTISGRELRSGFLTPLAYVIIASFLILAGFFFFTLLQQFNSFMRQSAIVPDRAPGLNQWVITPYYQTLQVVLIFLVPILTMRSIAEEKQSGTFELLATSPLKINEIVFGKFLGVSTITLIMLLLSFMFPAVLILLADPELLPTLCGFLGLVLFSLAYTALGISISAFTKNQTVAGVVSLVLLLLFYVIDAPAGRIGGVSGKILEFLAPGTHTELFFKGVIQGQDIVYFLSVVAFGLFITARALEASRWR